MKKRYYVEAAIVYAWLGLTRLLPLDMASALGGKLGRLVGSLVHANRIAARNIARVFPELNATQQHQMRTDMWEHLGRVIGEFSHLNGDTLNGRVTYTGMEHLPKPGEAALFISGHIGNWELLPSIAKMHGFPIVLVYRHINNPILDKMVARYRGFHSHGMIPKGVRGGVKIAHTIKNKQSLAMLVDQKMNEGIPVPFFGQEAMTGTAIALLSLRYKLPIIPVKVVRTRGAHFHATVDPAIAFTPTGDTQEYVKALLTQINTLLESWIRQTPEQWFWVHRRWPREAV